MNKFKLKPNVKRIQKNIETLAEFVDCSKSGWTRRPFTSWYIQSRKWLKNEMISIGMEVNTDAASNLIGKIEGNQKELSPIMIGSHTDTVMGGGRFDGIIGVLAGLEIARRMKEENIKLEHSLEIVDFTAEEPSDFGISTIGSRGMVNNITTDMLDRRDSKGNVLREEIRKIGGCPELISQNAREKGSISLYLELHIEQGPVLEEMVKKLGIVTGIVGINRYRVTITGKPNHAGTTPMNMRQDALAAASEFVLYLELICNEEHKEQVVGTVGKLDVHPNASNVLPGKVILEFEVRSLDESLSNEIISRIKDQAKKNEEKREIKIDFDQLSLSKPVTINSHVLEVTSEACKLTADSMFLPSGAGHDANQIATIAPIGMIFVKSCGGRSHCPEEWTPYEDVALGAEAMARSLVIYDQKCT